MKTIQTGWAPIGLGALLAVVYGVSGLQYLSVPPSPDQSIFDYIGYLSLAGTPPYRGAFDVTWPGALLYHKLGVALFGVQTWTARATDLLLLPIGLAGLWLHMRADRHPTAGLLAAVAYPILYVTSGGWMAGCRDLVAMHMLLCATGLMLNWRERHPAMLAAGLLIGYAICTRPTYAAILAPILFVELSRARQKGRDGQIFSFLGGIAGVTGGFVLLLLAEGAIGDWYQQAVMVPLTIYYTDVSAAFMGTRFLETFRDFLPWLSIAGLSGLGAYLLRGRHGVPAIYLLALFGTALLSFVVQRKGFYYHLGGLIPLFVLTSFLGACRLRRWSRARASDIAASLLAAAAAGALAWGIAVRAHQLLPVARHLLPFDGDALARHLAHRDGIAAQRRAIAALIRSESRPEDRVLQWGWNYEVPFLAQRKPATRFINGLIMSEISRDDRRYAPWLAAMQVEIARSRPRFMLFDLSVLSRYGSFHRTRSPAVNILFAFRDDYSIRRATADMILLERRPARAMNP